MPHEHYPKGGLNFAGADGSYLLAVCGYGRVAKVSHITRETDTTSHTVRWELLSDWRDPSDAEEEELRNLGF